MTKDKSAKRLPSRKVPMETDAGLEEASSILKDIATEEKGSRLENEREQSRQLREAAQRRARPLRGVTCTIASDLDVNSLVQRILKEAIQVTGAERGIVFFGRVDDVGLVPILAHKISRQSLDQIERVSRTILARARESEVIVTQDAREDPELTEIPSVHTKDIQSVACAPLIAEGKCIGALYLDAPAETWSSVETVKQTLQSFAELAAVCLRNARLYGDAVQESLRLQQAVDATDRFGRMLHESPCMVALLRRAALVARLDAPILIQGESGTGKELLARAIHAASARARSPFVGFNCAAVPEGIMESIFFGHRKGAFTGAQRDNPGLLRDAHRGTLFLDEITDLRGETQAKFLRVLEDGMVRPVGGREEHHSDFRLISATNKDIHIRTREGQFREDLYFRVNVIELRIPPLRERTEDIPLLVDHFLHKHAADRSDSPVPTLSPDAMEHLTTLHWRGNVRELENLIRRALILTDKPRLDVGDLERLVPADERMPARPSEPEQPSGWSPMKTLAELERDAIRAALIRRGGNKAKAARMLGLHRSRLLRRIQRLQVTTET